MSYNIYKRLTDPDDKAKNTWRKYISNKFAPFFTMYFAVKRSDKNALPTGPGLRLRDPAPLNGLSLWS